MELRQLQYFVAMYEEGSVTSASRRMNIVQPAISHQLAKLEAELGNPLFHRTPKGLVPTHAGQEAYRLLLPILHALDRARQDLAADRKTVKGHVSVGVVASVAHNALSETLIGFNAKYPEVTLRATGGYTDEMLDMLRTARLDLAVINAPARRTGYTHIDLISEDLALICAPGTRAPGGHVTLEGIDQNRLVIPSMRHGLRRILEEAAQAQGVRLAPGLEIDEPNTIETFVMNTDFMTLLPPITVHNALRDGRLRLYPVSPRIPRRIVCAYSPARPLSRAAEVFIAELHERLVAVPRELSEALHRDSLSKP